MPKLVVFPLYVSNPYLAMSNLAPIAAGWQVEGAWTSGAVGSAPQRGDVVHVHWTAPVLRQATTAHAARRHVDDFARALDSAKSRGAKLLWTVHNEVAHDTRWHEEEVRIAEVLADRADAIIQLHDLTAEAVASSYALPAEKLVTLRHASYLGLYGPGRTPVEARAALGIETGEHVIGFIGQLRRYKGIAEVCAAVDRAAEEIPDLTLILAGAVNPADADWVETVLPTRARLVRHDGFVPDAEIADWVCASDVVVLPYRKVLNSGSILLAASYGRQAVIPEDTPIAEVYRDQPWVHSYSSEGDEVANLATTMLEAARDCDSGAAAIDFARAWTPYDMSRSYLEVLERVVDA